MTDDVRPIPTAIDTLRDYCPEGRTRPDCGYMGGLEWDPAFDRYIRRVLPLTVVEARRIQREWWKNATLLTHVRAVLAYAWGERQATEVLTSVLLLYTEPRQPYKQVARECQHSLDWLLARKVEVLRVVRLLNP